MRKAVCVKIVVFDKDFEQKIVYIDSEKIRRLQNDSGLIGKILRDFEKKT